MVNLTETIFEYVNSGGLALKGLTLKAKLKDEPQDIKISNRIQNTVSVSFYQ